MKSCWPLLVVAMLFLPSPVPIGSEPPSDPVSKAKAKLALAGYTELPPVLVVEVDDLPQLSETLRREILSSTAFRIVIQHPHDPAKDRLDPVIYLYRHSQIYRLAEEGSEAGIALLAASIVHELVHDYADEGRAYAVEAGLLEKWALASGMSIDDRMLLAQFALVKKEQSKNAQIRASR